MDTDTPARSYPIAAGEGARLHGWVWEDRNGNGRQEPTEGPLPGAEVVLMDEEGRPLALRFTDHEGLFEFAELEPGIYRLRVRLPGNIIPTTPEELSVSLGPGAEAEARFGGQPVGTPTPIPAFDTAFATPAACGGQYTGSTQDGINRAEEYPCLQGWPQTGPEQVYKLERNAGGPLTVQLAYDASIIDLDVFVLEYPDPAYCLSGGDRFVTLPNAPAGPLFIVVDGYRGSSGAYQMEVMCDQEPRATVTPTPTPTATPTLPPGPTPTATPTPIMVDRQYFFIPTAFRTYPLPTPASVRRTLQDGFGGYVGTRDTFLSEWSPALTYGKSDRMSVRSERGQTAMTPLIYFDLSVLPASAQITKAELELWVTRRSNNNSITVSAHRLLRSWDEEQATWMHRMAGQPWATPGARGAGEDYHLQASDQVRIDGVQRWMRLDVTPFVTQWVRNPSSNYGMTLRVVAADGNVGYDLASREVREVERRPRLIVHYWRLD